MDVTGFLNEIRTGDGYAGQMVYVREVEPRDAAFGEPARPLAGSVQAMLAARGIARLYSHQAAAIDAVRDGRDVLIATGTASGKSLGYVIPILESLEADRSARSLLLFPTKALCQDQFRSFADALKGAGLGDALAGVFDGDTPAATRRKLRDRASAVFSNPDMVHAALLPQHGRWADFLAHLRFLVVDEIHTYNGLFGSNAANLFRRFLRVCAHYGSRPQLIACSATVANPKELADRLTGRDFVLIDGDGSPRGRRTYVFWNPPRLREGDYRSRRSANVEAHDLMAALVARGVPTITFSKAKMTAEMIHRYVVEKLRKIAPEAAGRVAPYRGGYLPHERREIERRLFSGELLGVSATRALELGIDVGALDASIVVGYPGTLASFFQQSGRAGRQDRDALVVLVGLDTAVNQYVMSRPDYVFGRPVEQAVIDPDNAFVVLNHLRSATHELPMPDAEVAAFGPNAPLALRVLEENRKVTHLDGRWFHSAPETPQHEFSLRHYDTDTVLIENADTGEVLGELDELDAAPIVHPGAIYMHHGDTYRVLDLNLDKNIATVKPVEVDYYTQPLGGVDVHHIDHQLREKPFGSGRAFWGEVTAYDRTWGYERIHFYSLDALSQHRVDLPPFAHETMAFWIVASEGLMQQVRGEGLDVHGGLRAVGYATRMLLPLFITCDTLDFSHSIGSVNSPWNAIFVFERCRGGFGFTDRAYEVLHDLMPAVLANVRKCPCEAGCPCCVGKPLRQYAVWNVERGEGSIPSKAAAVRILEGLLGDSSALNQPDAAGASDSEAAHVLRLERALGRRLERMREPKVMHPIQPRVETGYPGGAKDEAPPAADVTKRRSARRDFHRELDRRIAKKIETDELKPLAGAPPPPPGMIKSGQSRKPTSFPGEPQVRRERETGAAPPKKTISLGDPLAARVRKRGKGR